MFQKRTNEKRKAIEWEIAAALSDGPKSLADIVDHFHSYARLVGFFGITKGMERRHEHLETRIREALETLQEGGWVERHGERYALTSLGLEGAQKPLADMRMMRVVLDRLAQPQTVSQVGLGVHLLLAALKLPAALLSGSVGLLNDATDTLLDGLSSVLVYLGLRFDKERAANIVLVLLMLLTGGYTFYEAVRRFFVPFEPQVDWFTFLATIVSALACGALYFYQRLVGLRSGSMALITQSVDSRNHVIVAASVTAGLLASLLRFPLLDTLVGLGVALLILKSAVELTIETVRSLGTDEVDLSRYHIELAGWYKRFRQAQVRDWMLYLVGKQGVRTRGQLVAQAEKSLDFGGNLMLRELGVRQQGQGGKAIQTSLTELLERGWLVEDDQLSITDSGREHLLSSMSGG